MSRSFHLLELAVAGAFVLGLVSTPVARACTCITIPTLPVALQNSDAVFTGVVAGIASAEPEYPHFVWVTLNVTAVWKGSPGTQARVLTGSSSAACGVEFDLNREWLVFGRNLPGEPGALGTGACGRTAPALNNPDVVDLGPTPTQQRSWGKLKALYR